MGDAWQDKVPAYVLREDELGDESFADVLSRVPSHDGRMRKAAELAKVGSPLVADALSGLAAACENGDFVGRQARRGDPNVWVGLYAVVAATTQRKADWLQTIVHKSPSWLLRARALQALGKIDQPALLSIVSDKATPVQLKVVGMKCLCTVPEEKAACDRLFELILGESSWGGVWAAALLLQRLPKGSAHAAAIEFWLPRVASLAALAKQGEAVNKEAWQGARKDMESIYQSVSSKHPDLFLRVVAKETTFDFRYYRAAQCIASSRPAEVAALFLSKTVDDDSARWFFLRPLAWRRPLDTLAILKQVGQYTPVAAVVAKKLLRGPAAVRDACLDTLSDLVERPAAAVFSPKAGGRDRRTPWNFKLLKTVLKAAYSMAEDQPVRKLNDDYVGCVESLVEGAFVPGGKRLAVHFVPPFKLVAKLLLHPDDRTMSSVSVLENVFPCPAARKHYEAQLTHANLVQLYKQDLVACRGDADARPMASIRQSFAGFPHRPAAFAEALEQTDESLLGPPTADCGAEEHLQWVSVPECRETLRREVRRWLESEEYGSWLPSRKAGLWSCLPFEASRASIEALLAVKDPQPRADILCHYWKSLANDESGSPTAVVTALGVLSRRLANEEVLVRSSVSLVILDLSLFQPAKWAALADAAVAKQLDEFFRDSLKWLEGAWIEAWVAWGYWIRVYADVHRGVLGGNPDGRRRLEGLAKDVHAAHSSHPVGKQILGNPPQGLQAGCGALAFVEAQGRVAPEIVTGLQPCLGKDTGTALSTREGNNVSRLCKCFEAYSWPVFSRSPGAQAQAVALIDAVARPLSEVAALAVLHCFFHEEPKKSAAWKQVLKTVHFTTAVNLAPGFYSFAPFAGLLEACLDKAKTLGDVAVRAAVRYVSSWTPRRDGVMLSAAKALRKRGVSAALAYEVAGWRTADRPLLLKCGEIFSCCDPAPRPALSQQQLQRVAAQAGRDPVFTALYAAALRHAGGAGKQGYPQVPALTPATDTALAALWEHLRGTDPKFFAVVGGAAPLPLYRRKAVLFTTAVQRWDRVRMAPRHRFRFERGSRELSKRSRLTAERRQAHAHCNGEWPAALVGGARGFEPCEYRSIDGLRRLVEEKFTADTGDEVLRCLGQKQRAFTHVKLRGLVTAVAERLLKLDDSRLRDVQAFDYAYAGSDYDCVSRLLLRLLPLGNEKRFALPSYMPPWRANSKCEQLLNSSDGYCHFAWAARVKSHVLRCRQDLYAACVARCGFCTAHSLQGLVVEQGMKKERFAGQTHGINRSLPVLRPDLQQYTLDALDFTADDDVARATAAVWVAAHLPCPSNTPCIDNPEHPFPKIFAATLEGRRRLRDLRAAATAATEDEPLDDAAKRTLTAAEKKEADNAEVCLQLLLAMRAHDDPRGALRVLVEHINRGVASKSAIPSTAAAVRCVEPLAAYEVLAEVLGRKSTKIAARAQLCRAAIMLLPDYPEQAKTLVTREWKMPGDDDASTTGSWTLVEDVETDQPAEDTPAADEGPATDAEDSVKAAIAASLVKSRLLAKVPLFFDALKNELEPERVRTSGGALEVLQALAGTHSVATLCADGWPYCAPAGLVGAVASCCSNAMLAQAASKAVGRWTKHVNHYLGYTLDEEDERLLSDMVVGTPGHASGNAAAVNVIALFASRGLGNPVAVLRRKVDALKDAAMRGDRKALRLAPQFFNCLAESDALLKISSKTLSGMSDVLLAAPQTSLCGVDLLCRNFMEKIGQPEAGLSFELLAAAFAAGERHFLTIVSRVARQCLVEDPPKAKSLVSVVGRYAYSEKPHERLVAVSLAKTQQGPEILAIMTKSAADPLLCCEAMQFFGLGAVDH
ncbi:hypothetical protein DIPPA_16119 [Diplonema papillatum]|nr:hypothetical protein DIPPA_16119 [Diplonema papillatum]